MRSAPSNLIRLIYHRIRRYIGSLSGTNHALHPDVRVLKRRLGTEYGGWVIATDALPKTNSIVYSFGLGEDISFDLEMITNYHSIVHGFDPTPTLADWGKRSDLPKEFHFHDVGLGDHDGTLLLGAPAILGQDDFSVLRADSTKAVSFPVARLETLMRQLGHVHVDVVKINIEGAEFTAIKDILRSSVRPSQLLIEFHFFGVPDGLKMTLDCVSELRNSGYLIFDVEPLGRAINFIHKDALKKIRATN